MLHMCINSSTFEFPSVLVTQPGPGRNVNMWIPRTAVVLGGTGDVSNQTLGFDPIAAITSLY